MTSLNVTSARWSSFPGQNCRATVKRQIACSAKLAMLSRQAMVPWICTEWDTRNWRSTSALNVRNPSTANLSWQGTWEFTQKKNHLSVTLVDKSLCQRVISELIREGTQVRRKLHVLNVTNHSFLWGTLKHTSESTMVKSHSSVTFARSILHWAEIAKHTWTLTSKWRYFVVLLVGKLSSFQGIWTVIWGRCMMWSLWNPSPNWPEWDTHMNLLMWSFCPNSFATRAPPHNCNVSRNFVFNVWLYWLPIKLSRPRFLARVICRTKLGLGWSLGGYNSWG